MKEIKEEISDSMKKWILEYFKDEWVEINTEINFDQYEPIDISSSLHIIQYTYDINDNKYRLSYSIDDLDANPLIEILKT